MPVRAICNFIYVYCKPRGDGVTQDDIDKYDSELYADPADAALQRSLIQRMQMGG